MQFQTREKHREKQKEYGEKQKEEKLLVIQPDPLKTLEKGRLQRVLESRPVQVLYSIAQNEGVQNVAQLVCSLALSSSLGDLTANVVVGVSIASARALARYAQTGDKYVFREEAANLVTSLLTRVVVSSAVGALASAVESSGFESSIGSTLSSFLPSGDVQAAQVGQSAIKGMGGSINNVGRLGAQAVKFTPYLTQGAQSVMKGMGNKQMGQVGATAAVKFTPFLTQAGQTAVDYAKGFNMQTVVKTAKMASRFKTTMMVNGFLTPRVAAMLGVDLKRRAMEDFLLEEEAGTKQEVSLSKFGKITRLATASLATAMLGAIVLNPDAWSLFLGTSVLSLFGSGFLASNVVTNNALMNNIVTSAGGFVTSVGDVNVSKMLHTDIGHLTMGHIFYSLYESIKSNVQRLFSSTHLEGDIKKTTVNLTAQRFRNFFTRCLSTFDLVIQSVLLSGGIDADSSTDTLFQFLGKNDGYYREVLETIRQQKNDGILFSKLAPFGDPLVSDPAVVPPSLLPSSRDANRVDAQLAAYLEQWANPTFQTPWTRLSARQQEILEALSLETPSLLEAQKELAAQARVQEQASRLYQGAFGFPVPPDDIQTSKMEIDIDMLNTLLLGTKLEQRIDQVDRVKAQKFLEVFSAQKQSILSSQRGWQIFMASLAELLP